EIINSMQGLQKSLILDYVKIAENHEPSDQNISSEIRGELVVIHKKVHKIFTPIVLLYDLRNIGGIAHKPNIEKFREIATQLNLPAEKWKRKDFILITDLIQNSIDSILSIINEATTHQDQD